MKDSREARARRTALHRSWAAFMSGTTVTVGIRDEVLSSWRRTRPLCCPDFDTAPSGQADVDHAALLSSSHILNDAAGMFRDSNVVVGLADVDGQIVWTTGDSKLLGNAEKANFAPGGMWDEASIGVTAMSLALSGDRPSAVWSAEHWWPVLHEWSCYAAPIWHPTTRQRFGVLNLATPWDKAHPAFCLAASALAERVGAAIAASHAAGDLGFEDANLTVLGEHFLTVAGRRVRLTPRQVEIALLLALRPTGVGLAELHADLYGDRAVEMSTLKAEVAHLRRILGGRVSRTPYRLTAHVSVDALELLEDLRNGRLSEAVARFNGPLLPWSESPRIVRLARTVEVAIRDAVLNSDDYESALALAAHMDDDTQLADHILEILPCNDGRRHILQGHLSSIA